MPLNHFNIKEHLTFASLALQNESFHAVGVGLVPVDPPSGCGWPRNADNVEGNIALVERG